MFKFIKVVICFLVLTTILFSCKDTVTITPPSEEELAKSEISQMVIHFMHMFEKLMYLDADEIVKDFTQSCRGREHQRQTILNHQASWKIDPFELEVQFLEPVTVDDISSDYASGIRITNKFISVRIRDGFRNEVVATHIYTSLVESERWWLCNYKVEYHSGSKALFNSLFPFAE